MLSFKFGTERKDTGDTHTLNVAFLSVVRATIMDAASAKSPRHGHRCKVSTRRLRPKLAERSDTLRDPRLARFE